MRSLLAAEEVIALLDLSPLPVEGGFFRQTYAVRNHPELGSADPQASAIFYLVTAAACSALHRLRYDEMFHFYLGDPCDLGECDSSGTLERCVLGQDLSGDQHVQHLVPGGTWQGLHLRDGGRYPLPGTTMAPGFRPDAFELAAARDLVGFASDVREALIPFLAPSNPTP